MRRTRRTRAILALVLCALCLMVTVYFIVLGVLLSRDERVGFDDDDDNLRVSEACTTLVCPESTVPCSEFICIVKQNGEEECVLESTTCPPTQSPTQSPTESPTLSPTESPTLSPTESPTLSPTESPTLSPTKSPTEAPTRSPTESPTKSPTQSPTKAPSLSPTQSPTKAPSLSPTQSPTKAPSLSPTQSPTKAPSLSPTQSPTKAPSLSPTLSPTRAPTLSPTAAPSFITPPFVNDTIFDFENASAVNLIDFAGTSSIIDDPFNPGLNQVVCTNRTFGALVFAGTLAEFQPSVPLPLPTALKPNLAVDLRGPLLPGVPILQGLQLTGNPALDVQVTTFSTVQNAFETIVADVFNAPNFNASVPYDRYILIYDNGGTPNNDLFYWDNVRLSA